MPKLLSILERQYAAHDADAHIHISYRGYHKNTLNNEQVPLILLQMLNGMT